jgi:hypothetical protein
VVKGPHLLASLLYLTLRRILQLVLLRCRSREFKELEIVVLRHDVRFFAAKLAAQGCKDADRAFLAAARKRGGSQVLWFRVGCAGVPWHVSGTVDLLVKCPRMRDRSERRLAVAPGRLVYAVSGWVDGRGPG